MSDALLLRIALACERLAARWAGEDIRDSQPVDPCGTFPSPVLPPIVTAPVDPFQFNPPPLTEHHFDLPAYDWANPGSFRRFIGVSTKFLEVPAGFKGRISLETGRFTQNVADSVTLTVTDGPRIVATETGNPDALGLRMDDVVGPKLLAINCDTWNAVITVKFNPLPLG